MLHETAIPSEITRTTDLLIAEAQRVSDGLFTQGGYVMHRSVVIGIDAMYENFPFETRFISRSELTREGIFAVHAMTLFDEKLVPNKRMSYAINAYDRADFHCTRPDGTQKNVFFITRSIASYLKQYWTTIRPDKITPPTFGPLTIAKFSIIQTIHSYRGE